MERQFKVWPIGEDLSKHGLSYMVGNTFIGSGDTGRVYGGFGPKGETIAIKMSFDRERLLREWQVYLALSKRGLDRTIIPQCFGLYENRNFAILVTEFAGVELADMESLGRDDR
jgi:hypothetical protein